MPPPLRLSEKDPSQYLPGQVAGIRTPVITVKEGYSAFSLEMRKSVLLFSFSLL